MSFLEGETSSTAWLPHIFLSDFHPAVWERGSLHRVSIAFDGAISSARVLPRGQKSCHIVLKLVVSFDWHKWVAFYAWWCKNKQLTLSRNRVLKHAYIPS